MQAWHSHLWRRGLVRSLSLFFGLKDLLHTTNCQDVLLAEQTRLQEDLQERVKKLEGCQKEEERKQQHLQALQSEVEEKESELARQEMVPHPTGGPGAGTLPQQASPRLSLRLPALCDLRGFYTSSLTPLVLMLWTIKTVEQAP